MGRQVFKKNHQWQVDQDYINDLVKMSKNKNLSKEQRNEAKKALKFVDKFNDEYYNGYFKKGEKSLHKKSQRKECYGRVNSQNRDVSSIVGAQFKMSSYYELSEDEQDPTILPDKKKQKILKINKSTTNVVEDSLNELIDLKRESEKKDKQ